MLQNLSGHDTTNYNPLNYPAKCSKPAKQAKILQFQLTNCSFIDIEILNIELKDNTI